MLPGDSVEVSVVHPSPAWREGLESALSRAGYRLAASGSIPPEAVVVAPVDSLEFGSWSERGLWVAVVEEESVHEYQRALALGAGGVVSEDTPIDRIVATVEGVLAGMVPVPLPILQQMALTAAVPIPDGLVLSELDWELLRALTRGDRVEEMATKFRYSARTVTRQLARLYRRIGVEDRNAAVKKAIRWGIGD